MKSQPWLHGRKRLPLQEAVLDYQAWKALNPEWCCPPWHRTSAVTFTKLCSDAPLAITDPGLREQCLWSVFCAPTSDGELCAQATLASLQRSPPVSAHPCDHRKPAGADASHVPKISVINLRKKNPNCCMKRDRFGWGTSERVFWWMC